MKQYIKRICSFLLATVMVCSLSFGLLLDAGALSYSGSSSYASGPYYTALQNVTLTGNQRTDIVNIAKSQIGYQEGANSSSLSGTVSGSGNYTEYGRWYGLQDMWCQMFVSWCAYNAGVSTSVIAKTASTVTGLTQFINNGQAYSRATVASGGYTPQAGDIVYFKSPRNNNITNHVGIVTGYSGGVLSTVEGNTSSATISTNGGAVCAKTYDISNTYIVYICCPAYTNAIQIPGVYSVTASSLRVRSGPGTSYDQVGGLTNGQNVEVTEIVDGWGKVTVGSVSGYASMKYLAFVSVLPGTPEYSVTASSLNVRAGVGTSNAILGTLSNGAKVYVTATDSGWALIKYNDLIGWCSMKYLTPVQQTISYTVAFDANGGSGTMSDMAFTYGNAQNLTANAFTRKGHTFLGWSTSASATSVTYTDGQSVSNLTSTADATVTLYAVWSANAYTVTFDANGGSGTMSDMAFTYGTYQNLNANTFTRKGYTFLGWAKTATATTASYTDGKSVRNLTSTAGATVTLYAIWSANAYTVTFDANGGSGSMTDVAFTYGTYQDLPTNTFTRKGYTFLGWAKSATATSATYTDEQSVRNLSSTAGATVTLYAVWSPNTYTVTFDANGGSGSMADMQFTYGIYQDLNANTFTREGYTFLGWSFSATATAVTYTDGQNVRNLMSLPNALVTLYAVWGESGSEQPVTVPDEWRGGRLYRWNGTEYVPANGFVETENGILCYENGYQVIGWRHADGSPAQVVDGVYEQYSQNPEGLYYFLSSTGYMVTDASYTLGGYLREFNDDHTVKSLNGLQSYYGLLYYYVDGVRQTGWQVIDGETYYFQASDAVYGQAATMWMVIGGNVYYFYSTTSAKPYTLKTSGTIGGIAYDYDPTDGHILCDGFLNCEYANSQHSNVASVIGMQNATARYYEGGVMQYGWKQVGGDWYYLYLNGSSNGSGYLCTVSRTIGGTYYNFRSDGVCLDKQ